MTNVTDNKIESGQPDLLLGYPASLSIYFVL
ncbi:Uncharacterised protein [Yersinia aleksiciae]|uniref:Uncharacterized protein n=1 Tax=Yersinia aleksiciae TaxID=263819 RepID=A0A0T9T296_YERAE|nr:Uncharacterised protein [Yersinia aleksiciae]CNK57516.1 Uncharacterised protein [Yersinia aleksiciae]